MLLSVSLFLVAGPPGGDCPATWCNDGDDSTIDVCTGGPDGHECDHALAPDKAGQACVWGAFCCSDGIYRFDCSEVDGGGACPDAWCHDGDFTTLDVCFDRNIVTNTHRCAHPFDPTADGRKCQWGAFCCQDGRAAEVCGGDGTMVVNWPDESFESLQEAVDAVPDGGTLRLGAGEFVVEQPIVRKGKRIHIVGAGCSMCPPRSTRPGERVNRPIFGAGLPQATDGPTTRLVAPPSPVFVDVRSGIFELNDAGGTIRNLELSGGYSGILATSSGDGIPPSLTVQGVRIRHAEHGILWTVPAALHVKGSLIEDTASHGILVAGLGASEEHPDFLWEPKAVVHNTLVRNARGACMLFDQTPGYVSNVSLGPCDGAPGIVALGAPLFVNTSRIRRATSAGILFWESDGLVSQSVIQETAPDSDGRFGDGVIGVLSPEGTTITLQHNYIREVARAGVSLFSAKATLHGVSIECSPIDIAVENDFAGLGVDFELADLGDNECGCPAGTAECHAQSVGLLPSPPP